MKTFILLISIAISHGKYEFTNFMAKDPTVSKSPLDELSKLLSDLVPLAGRSSIQSTESNILLTSPMSNVVDDFVFSVGQTQLCGSGSGCCDCIVKSLQHIMREVIHKVEEKCRTTKCPVLQKACEFAKHHPLVAIGFIAEKVRPLPIAEAYCFGHGDCEHPSNVNNKLYFPNFLDLADLYPDIHDNQMLELPETRRAIPPLPSSEIEQISEELVTCSDEAPVSIMPIVYSEHKTAKPCPVNRRCACRTTKLVIRWSVKRLVHYCKTSNNEKLQKFCNWAHAHPQVALGFIIGFVEPWKFAVGFCWKGPHPHKHRHGHRRVSKASRRVGHKGPITKYLIDPVNNFVKTLFKHTTTAEEENVHILPVQEDLSREES